MFAQELALAYETIENCKNYESVVNAIHLERIEQALLDTSKACIRRRRLPAQEDYLLGLWLHKSLKQAY